ncbi:MAG: ATP-binding protein [Hasllibacter sp.]
MEQNFEADRIAQALRAAGDIGVPMFVWRRTGAADRTDGWTLEGINPAYAAATGVTPEGFRDRTLAEILPARGAAAVLDHYVQALAADGPYAYEEELDVNDGAKWWQTTLTPIRGADGAPEGMVGVAFDITARKHEAFVAANDIARLRRMNEEVRVFASMAAHDVRGPLATLFDMLGIIKSGFEDLGDGKLALLRQCRAITVGARRQMDRLLAHAVSLEQAEGEIAPLELGPLCADVATLIDPHGAMAMAWPDEPIECDATALQLILRNLMGNAARHGAGRIEVGVEAVAAGRIRIVIDDDGPGFPAGFDPFGAAATMKRARTAHGFGLGAVRYLCEARGGSLTFGRSGLGGARAAFELPGRATGRASRAPRPDRVAAHAA